MILWKLMTDIGVIPFYLYELLPGFVFSLLANYVVSKMGKRPSEDIINEYKLAESLIA